MTPPMILNYVVGTQGYPWEAWRHADGQVDRVTDFGLYLEQARLAERGRFDTLFLVDHLALFPTPDAPLFWTLDPVQLMTALAVHTEHIGLIATVGTSFTNPYATARRLATLDHLSNGRAGWNVVTSASDQEARNHGRPGVIDRDTRYRRAREFLDACLQLWHAWDPDAVTADKTRLSPVDTGKIRAINFEGAEIKVRGPLGTPRSPQVVPVICQAGPSPSGREIAGRYADLVYANYASAEESRSYRTDLRARARAAGRAPAAIRLIPQFMVFVKSTDAEARRFHRELMELSSVEARLNEVAHALGAEIGQHDAHATVPPELVATAEQRWPWVITTEAVEWPPLQPTITWTELVRAVDAEHQHHVLVGTPEHVAGRLADGYEAGAYDGASIGVPLVPDAFSEFVDLVVPLLQARGVHKRDYAPGTLRERLGLPPTQHIDTDHWTPYYTA